MSSACFIQVDVATALAVTSRGLRVRISRATAAGTMIVCAACRSRSTRPARLRQMSGEALTTAWSGIGQFSPERIHVDREGIHTLLARDRMKSVRSSPATWAARSCEMRPREYQWTTAFALTHAPCPIDGRWSRNIRDVLQHSHGSFAMNECQARFQTWHYQLRYHVWLA